MSSFTLDELVRNFYVKAGKPVLPLENRLNNFWLVDLPGVNAQERTRDKLIESLKMGAEDMINAPVELKEQEELVQIGV